MDLKIVNVIIDKKKFKDNNYHVLENALKYNIQRSRTQLSASAGII